MGDGVGVVAAAGDDEVDGKKTWVDYLEAVRVRTWVGDVGPNDLDPESEAGSRDPEIPGTWTGAVAGIRAPTVHRAPAVHRLKVLEANLIALPTSEGFYEGFSELKAKSNA